MRLLYICAAILTCPVKFSDKVETKPVTQSYKKGQFSKPNLANAVPGGSERKRKRQAYVRKRVKDLKKY